MDGGDGGEQFTEHPPVLFLHTLLILTLGPLTHPPSSTFLSVSCILFFDLLFFHHQHIRTKRRFGFFNDGNRLKYRLILLMALRFVPSN